MTKTIKRTIIAVLLLCTVLAFACFSACDKETPENPEVPDIILSEDGTTVVGLNNKVSNLVILSEYNGVTVTSIGDFAFYNRSSLTSVTIPDTITSIGEFAFRGCSSLMSVTIPNGVTNIEMGAFSKCSSLVSITIPDSVTSIGRWAFYQCGSLTSIEIPNCITSIEDSAFENCSKLTEIKYNATECSDLKSSDWVFFNAGVDGSGIKVTIGKNVKKIPARLFDSDKESGPKITKVVFEEGSVCESIGEYAFNNSEMSVSVYYCGTAAQWKNISINSNNSNLTSATCYYGYDGQNHTYSFNTNGSEDIEEVTSNFAIKLPTPDKKDYVFCGWYDNEECQGTAYKDKYYSPTKTKLYAKWLTEEEYYDGSSFEKAKTVTAGESFTANIDTAGKTLYYKFKATESKSYTIKSSGDLDTYGCLYNSNKSQLKDNVGNTDFLITYSLIADDTYYIVVKMHSSSATGAFTVSITLT